MQYSIEELLAWNQKGLIPGPDENDSDFFTRARYFLEKTAKNVSEQKPLKALQEKLSKLYDISIDFIDIEKATLLPWQAALSEFYEQKPYLRIFVKERQNFFYSLEEQITHELAHAGRMAFLEEEFEEILAYQTSPKRFRRFFGPLIRSTLPSWLSIASIAFIFDLAHAFYEQALFLSLALKALALFFFAFDLFILYEKQSVFQSCLKNLSQITKEKSLAIAYRLSDQEIRLFAKKNANEIYHLAKEQSEQSNLRWKVLFYSYFDY